MNEAIAVGANATLTVQLPKGGTTNALVHGDPPDGVTVNWPGGLAASGAVRVILADEVLVSVTVCGAEVVPST